MKCRVALCTDAKKILRTGTEVQLRIPVVVTYPSESKIKVSAILSGAKHF